MARAPSVVCVRFRMTKKSKILLALAVAMFAAGITPAGGDLMYGLLKPMAAVLVIVVFLLEVVPEERGETHAAPAAKPGGDAHTH